MPVEIVVAESVSLAPEFEESIQAAYQAAASKLDISSALVCIRVCEVAESRALNAQYRQQDKPTNVLSFPAEIEVDDVQILGDISLCWPVVLEEAAEANKTIADHAAHLTIHGILHLHGYDHQNSADAEEMEQLERDVLAGLGIADPYLE